MGLDIHAAVRREDLGTCTRCGERCGECSGCEWEVVPDSPSFGINYSGFAMLRERLAACDGITLRSMVGFEGGIPWDQIVSRLFPLLNHSDCGGELSPHECARVSERLAEILGNGELPEEPEWLRHRARRLHEVLAACAGNGWTAVFW